jgi:hypothetical protein
MKAEGPVKVCKWHEMHLTFSRTVIGNVKLLLMFGQRQASGFMYGKTVTGKVVPMLNQSGSTP